MAAKTGAQAEKDTDGAQEGPYLADIFRFLWKGWPTVLSAASLGAALAALYLVYVSVSQPSTTSYREAIALTSKGTKPGFYPNGLAYSPTDIRSPAVLNSVFTAIKLSDFGLTQMDLASALTVAPYSPAERQIHLKFRPLLINDQLPAAERRRIEDEYQAALNSARADGALLTLTFNDSLSIPGQVSRKTLDAVLFNWVRLYVDELGVANAPNARGSKILVDEKQAAGLDYVQAYEFAKSAHEELRTRIAALSELPGINDVTLSETGRTLRDVAREADALGVLRIDGILAPIADSGLSRDAALTRLTLKSTALEANQNRVGLDRRMQLIDDIVRQSTAVSQRSAEAGTASATTLSQLSDSTVAQLVDLALKNADRPFVQELLTEKKELGKARSELTGRIETIERQIAAISAFETSGAQGSADLGSAELAGRFQKTIAIVAADLNRLWADIGTLTERVAATQLNAEKSIYVKMPILDSELSEGGLRSGGVWVRALMLLAFCTLAGLLLHLGRAALGMAK